MFIGQLSRDIKPGVKTKSINSAVNNFFDQTVVKLGNKDGFQFESAVSYVDDGDEEEGEEKDGERKAKIISLIDPIDCSQQAVLLQEILSQDSKITTKLKGIPQSFINHGREKNERVDEDPYLNENRKYLTTDLFEENNILN